MTKRLLPKPFWKNALGAASQPKRLKLQLNDEQLFSCPIETCDSEPYRSKRGCRKHVYTRHGWFYYFDQKPDMNTVFPERNTRMHREIKRQKRCSTTNMPLFPRTCRVAVGFLTWLKSPGGSGKDQSQAEQITTKVLKFAKFCCQDVNCNWDIPVSVIDFCIGSVTMLSDFVDYLRDDWKVGFSGCIGYMNAIGHMLDYRRFSNTCEKNLTVFVAAEIFMNRVKKYLSRKMKAEWRTVLSVEYLDSINCWATLQDLQKVVPYHSDKYKQIVINARNSNGRVACHELSFATSFIVTVLFLMVKPSRPMTYQNLTASMIKNVGNDGFIHATAFKTADKYGFDSLIFSVEVVALLNDYIDYIRTRLNPVCDNLLLTRNGKKLIRIADVFGRSVFQAIGKYINPSRYRQIIETESVTNLGPAEQAVISEDQKHTSRVAKVHYQKTNSQNVATQAKSCIAKLAEQSESNASLKSINNVSSNNEDVDILVETPVCTRQRKVPFSVIEDKYLQLGIRKYGKGKWTSILNDPDYIFDPTRKVSTLAVRAKTKKFV